MKQEYTVTEIENFWQLCPKCSGQGAVSKPPWIAGDINQWTGNTTDNHICDLCGGRKIISTITGLPPL